MCIAKNLPARVVPDVSTFDFLPCSFVRKRKKKKNCDITTYVLFLLFCEKDIEERGRMKNFFFPLFLKSFILFIRDKSIAPKETYMSSSLLGYSLHSRCVYLRHVLLYCRDR